MKIVSTLAFCTFIAPGIAFGMDLGQQERQQDRDPITEQQHTQDRDRGIGQTQRQDQFGERHDRMEQHRQTRRAHLDMTADGFLNTVPLGSVSVENLIGSSVRSQIDDEDIGTIEDILIDSDGNPLAVIVSVGGFLGIGDKDVALSWDNVQLSFEDDEGRLTAARVGVQPGARGAVTPDRDRMQQDQQRLRDVNPDDFVVVVNLTRDALENAPEFQRDWN